MNVLALRLVNTVVSNFTSGRNRTAKASRIAAMHIASTRRVFLFAESSIYSSSFRSVMTMYRPATAQRMIKPITESAVAGPFFWS